MKPDKDFLKLSYDDIQNILRFAHTEYLNGDKDKTITYQYLTQVSLIRGFIKYVYSLGYEIRKTGES